MPRIVRCGLIQAKNELSPKHSLPQIKKAMIDKHLKLIDQAAKKRAQILCLQELFYGPYFCAEQDARWYELTERVPDGPTTQLMQKVAAKHRMVIVVPVYEEQMPGLYFGLERGGDRVQPFGDGSGIVGVSLGVGAARACGGEWLFCRRDQSGWRREALEHR